MEKIDKLDRQILEIISQNARIPFKDVAAECEMISNICLSSLSIFSIMFRILIVRHFVSKYK